MWGWRERWLSQPLFVASKIPIYPDRLRRATLRAVAYRIRFARSADEHFVQLTARQQATVLDAVKAQLRYEPLRQTRHRKPLRPNPLAPWELRVGALRVFYEMDTQEPGLVNILAIGIKKGNRLIVAGKEIQI